MPFLFSFLLGPKAHPPQSPRTGRSVSSAALHLTPQSLKSQHAIIAVRYGSDLLL